MLCRCVDLFSGRSDADVMSLPDRPLLFAATGRSTIRSSLPPSLAIECGHFAVQNNTLLLGRWTYPTDILWRRRRVGAQSPMFWVAKTTSAKSHLPSSKGRSPLSPRCRGQSCQWIEAEEPVQNVGALLNNRENPADEPQDLTSYDVPLFFLANGIQLYAPSDCNKGK